MTLVRNTPDKYHAHSRDDNTIFVEFDKAFSPGLGLKLRYTLNDSEELVGYDYQPYYAGGKPKAYVNIEIQNLDDEHIAIAEDLENGNELVFSLQNATEFASGDSVLDSATVRLAGLSCDATIVLPVLKDEESERLRQEEEDERREQLRKARQGDAEAIEKLEIADEEISNTIQERLAHEDFLTVVEGFFMPTEDDDTQYCLLGDITNVAECANDLTGERLYVLSLSVTGTPIDICVNTEDVAGLPSVGMRFLGTCWLQGRLDVLT
ncbi:MAG: DUF3881 family protein [Defluviitaleaceae bacterium]|nr:DUF3881 family protein [Defluviitaleaceae bacterium]